MSSVKCSEYNSRLRIALAKGYCLTCGSQISVCGVSFTAEILCCNCFSVNVFMDSQQPVSARQKPQNTCGETVYGNGAHVDTL